MTDEKAQEAIYPGLDDETALFLMICLQGIQDGVDDGAASRHERGDEPGAVSLMRELQLHTADRVMDVIASAMAREGLAVAPRKAVDWSAAGAWMSEEPESEEGQAD